MAAKRAETEGRAVAFRTHQRLVRPCTRPINARRAEGAPRATSVIRLLVRKCGSPNRWLAALVARKPKTVAAVALANSERRSATGSSAPRTARMIAAVTTKQGDYRTA